MTHDPHGMTTIYKVWLLADGFTVRGYPRLYESRRGDQSVHAVARRANEYRARFPERNTPFYTVKVQTLQGVWIDG